MKGGVLCLPVPTCEHPWSSSDDPPRVPKDCLANPPWVPKCWSIHWLVAFCSRLQGKSPIPADEQKPAVGYNKFNGREVNKQESTIPVGYDHNDHYSDWFLSSSQFVDSEKKLGTIHRAKNHRQSSNQLMFLLVPGSLPCNHTQSRSTNTLTPRLIMVKPPRTIVATIFRLCNHFPRN